MEKVSEQNESDKNRLERLTSVVVLSGHNLQKEITKLNLELEKVMFKLNTTKSYQWKFILGRQVIELLEKIILQRENHIDFLEKIVINIQSLKTHSKTITQIRSTVNDLKAKNVLTTKLIKSFEKY